MTAMPLGYLYGKREHTRHYRLTPNGYVEKMLFINRDGFSREFEVEADVGHHRVYRPMRMKLDTDFTAETEVADILLFVRTLDRAEDGRVIFREGGWTL